ncbi:MAG TPA: alpha/beta hydrolase family protein [Pyrinomonadaceae bacterium]|nr:alpha/beta hydrolase family protein [Pyrinomonadaceae bacterium]
MRRRAGIAFSLVLVFAAVALVHAQAKTPSKSRLETIKFESKLIGKTLPYTVILPVGYHKSPTTRYPVLYLLHGLDGHYSDWTTRTNVADHAERYGLIIVTPEANDSWYVDSASVSSDKYESYILTELIPDVEARYRTIQSRYGRAIAGLSMGGYGAFKFALKSPAQFIFAASMSGAFGVTRYTEQQPGLDWGEYVQLFGSVTARKANDLFELTNNLSAARVAALPYFYFDCGTEDSPAIFKVNRELSELFNQKKIPHEYRELPGNHSWAYWDQQIQEVLKVAALKLRLPPVRK